MWTEQAAVGEQCPVALGGWQAVAPGSLLGATFDYVFAVLIRLLAFVLFCVVFFFW